MSNKAKDPKLTPMMRQYFEIKNRHPDKYLFFRLGDFYEMFDQDAVEVSSLLQITLTERNKIPMCGIPHHQLHRYAYKVIAHGKKIVIVEQDDKLSSNQGLVNRRIAQIITPGTTTDEMNLSAKAKNFIINFYLPVGDKLFEDRHASSGLVALETTTGEVVFEPLSGALDLKRALSRFFEHYSPTEIVLSDCYREHSLAPMLSKEYPQLILNYLPDPDPTEVKNKLASVYKNLPNSNLIDFGDPQFYSLYRGLFLLVSYTEENYGEKITYLQLPKDVKLQEFMVLDQQTIVHLEIFKNNFDHTQKHSLFSIIDYTRTPMGSRKLHENLALPSSNIKVIQKRLEQTDFLFKHPHYLKKLRGHLHNISDIERISARLALKRILPRDFLSLSRSLILIQKLFYSISEIEAVWLEDADFPGKENQSQEEKINYMLKTLEKVIKQIEDVLVEDPANDLNKGNYIKPLAHPRLNEYYQIKTQAEKLLSELEFKEKKKSQISSLKIRYNDNLGYFFETGKNASSKIPDYFIRKQSLVTCERYVSAELLHLDSQIKEARENSLRLELEIYNQLRDEMKKWIPFFQKISDFISRLDVVAGFAELASVRRWCKPEITSKNILQVKEGRHPVVEAELEDPFIPNDITIGTTEDMVQIITGPNMSGKSTFLRQNAIIVILAHMGCFVPARSAMVPLCDQIFTRIGSGDRLFQGESTFLVEMKETASILNNMTTNSLVIMDEIGRGTSTYDGLALAWSILEYINNQKSKQAKTLFATHYHELISLTQEKGITHYHVSIREEGEKIIFLKKVVKGVTSRSYGIQVARLAGIPEEVITNAMILLKKLEKKQEQVNPEELSLKIKEDEIVESEKKINRPSLWEEEILKFDVSSHTPLQTANFLSDLQKKIQKDLTPLD